jgi:hypothetical protein
MCSVIMTDNMSISIESSAREALFAFRMSLPWLKNLSTGALEGTGVLNLTKSLARTFMKAPAPRSTLDQLHSICLVDVARAPFHGCLCDGTKQVILRIHVLLPVTFKKYERLFRKFIAFVGF